MKNAIALNITLPSADEIADALAQMPARWPEPTTAVTHGFAPHPVTGELVTPLGGGALAFCLLTHKRVMPPKAIKAEVAKRCEAIKKELGRDATRKERNAAIQDVIADMLPQAFVEQELITIYYHAGALVIDTASAGKAQVVVAMLIKAMGPSDIALAVLANDLGPALTEATLDFLGGGRNQLCGDLFMDMAATISGPDGEKITFKDLPPEEAAAILNEHLRHGHQLKKLGVCTDLLALTINTDGRLTGIRFAEREASEELDEPAAWRANAGANLALVLDVIRQIVTGIVAKGESE